MLKENVVNDLSNIIVDLKKLEEIPEFLRTNPSEPNNPIIYELKSVEALYLATKIQYEINRQLAGEMEKMTQIVKASDKKTLGIYALSFFLFLVSAVTLLFIYHDSTKNEEYKTEIKKQTEIIANSTKELDSIITSIFKDNKIVYFKDSILYEIVNLKNAQKK